MTSFVAAAPSTVTARAYNHRGTTRRSKPNIVTRPAIPAAPAEPTALAPLHCEWRVVDGRLECLWLR